MHNMAQVDLDSVTKVFDDSSGTIVAVEELDININNGEFLALVGPSGCGKSTTLRMVAGLETITDGEIKIGDTVVNDMQPKDRDIAMVFQNYALYPHKTVRGNMSYGLHLTTDLTDEEIDKRTEEAAEMMGIRDLLDKQPGSLSGGQQQRVATGRAIVREPEVFLFDEPLSNLDAKLRTHMRTELTRLHTDLGITTIYVTHDQEEAMTMSDRIAVLNNGRIQQLGKPKEVYYEPTNLFVADFIGSPSMNFFDVTFAQNDDGTGQLIHDAFSYNITNSIVDNINQKDGENNFVLGIRPESVQVSGDISEEKSITATVEVVEVVGSDNYLYLDIGGTECRARTPPEIEPEQGSTIQITFDETQIHLFDQKSENAILHGYKKDNVESSSNLQIHSESKAERHLKGDAG